MIFDRHSLDFVPRQCITLNDCCWAFGTCVRFRPDSAMAINVRTTVRSAELRAVGGGEGVVMAQPAKNEADKKGRSPADSPASVLSAFSWTGLGLALFDPDLRLWAANDHLRERVGYRERGEDQ